MLTVFPSFRYEEEPEDATSADQIVDMYEAQASVGGNAAGDDDDF